MENDGLCGELLAAMAEIWNYRRWIVIALVAYWMALVFATHYPVDALPHYMTYQDKVLHFVAYAMFTSLLWLVLHTGPLRVIPYLGVFAVLGLAVHAALDEYTQQYFQGRIPDFFDYCADMAGVLFAIPIVDWFLRRFMLATR